MLNRGVGRMRRFERAGARSKLPHKQNFVRLAAAIRDIVGKEPRWRTKEDEKPAAPSK